MKKIFISLAVIFLYLNTSAQTTTLILHKEAGRLPYGFYGYPPAEEDTSPLVIPDSLHLKYHNYYFTYMAPVEENFQKVKQGTMSFDDFQLRLKRSGAKKNADTALLSRLISKYGSTKVHIISGVDEKNNKLLLIDANLDHKISNDEIFRFSATDIDSVKKNKDYYRKFKIVTFKQKATDGSTRDLNVRITPIPYFNSYDNESKTQTSFGFAQQEYWTGTTRIYNQDITIYAIPRGTVNELGDMRFNIKCDTIVNKVPIDIKDEWADNKFSLEIDTLNILNDGKIKLFLTHQSPPKKHNDTTFSMRIKNVKTGQLDSLGTLLHKGKFILIDYWGTWCAPCIAQIPDLKVISEKFSNKIVLISIAYDVSIDKVRSFEEKNQINWPGYFIDRTENQKLIKYLKVILYPTYRLYSDRGKLLFEGNSEQLTVLSEKLAKIH